MQELDSKLIGKLLIENEQLKIENEQLKTDVDRLSHNVVALGNTIKEKERIWGYLESRFVEVCKTCNAEEKAKCIMFPEYCEGQCKEIVDLEALIDKACEKGAVR